MAFEQILDFLGAHWQLVLILAVEEIIVVLQGGKSFEVLIQRPIHIIYTDYRYFVLALDLQFTFQPQPEMDLEKCSLVALMVLNLCVPNSLQIASFRTTSTLIPT